MGRCFPVHVVNFLRTDFSIELLWWLLLLRRKEKSFKWKKKMKTFHLNSTCSYVNIITARPFSLTFSSNFLSFHSCMIIFCVFISYKLKNIWKHITCAIVLFFSNGCRVVYLVNLANLKSWLQYSITLKFSVMQLE